MIIQPYLVVDQNCLRQDERPDQDLLRSPIDRCCRENLKLLIPEGAFFELSKGTRMLETWVRSLSFLSKYPELVCVSKKIATLRRVEIETGQPCRDIIADDLTEFLRDLLRQLNRSGADSLSSYIEHRVEPLMSRSVADWNGEKQKSLIIQMQGIFRRDLSAGFVKSIRLSENPSRTWLQSVDGTRFVFQGLVQLGFRQEAALELCCTKSVAAAFIGAISCIAMDWLGTGGIESAKPETISNDFCDMEYAVLASLSAGLVSRDKRVIRIHEALRDAPKLRYVTLSDLP